MSDEKIIPVFKISMRLQDGAMSAERGFWPVIPGDFLTVEYLMDHERANDKAFRDNLAIEAMDAFWKKLKKG